jgi:hypothetical protein
MPMPQDRFRQRFHCHRLPWNPFSRPRLLQLRVCPSAYHTTLADAMVSRHRVQPEDRSDVRMPRALPPPHLRVKGLRFRGLP